MTKRALLQVDPFSLPVGLRVGPWRVKGWRGRGAYGALYCVEHEGRGGEFALKLAIHAGDERFPREAELLRRIDSPYVPSFREQGVWEHPVGEQGPRVRSSRTAQVHAERDAAARQEYALREEAERRRARRGRSLAPLWIRAPRWRAAVEAGLLGVWLAGLAVAVWLRGQEGDESSLESKARQGGRVAVGDSTSTTPAKSTTPPAEDKKKRGVTVALPEQPLPGQNRPPCKRSGDVEIRGGCWYALRDLKPPCKEEGKEEAYLWKGACYGPSYPSGREPTSNPP